MKHLSDRLRSTDGMGEQLHSTEAKDGNFMSCTSASFQSANGSMGQTTMDDADSSVESSSLPDGNVLVTCVEKRDGRQE
uniref:Uncharacterized protein n=1 Tax=Ditylenchus dipsaci TaxID=166011 RepID=A0A915DMD3_9BILA